MSRIFGVSSSQKGLVWFPPNCKWELKSFKHDTDPQSFCKFRRGSGWSFQRKQVSFREDHPGTPKQTTTKQEGDSMIFTLVFYKICEERWLSCPWSSLLFLSSLFLFFGTWKQGGDTITKLIFPHEKGVVKSWSGFKCHGNDLGGEGVGKRELGKGLGETVFLFICPFPVSTFFLTSSLGSNLRVSQVTISQSHSWVKYFDSTSGYKIPKD